MAQKGKITAPHQHADQRVGIFVDVQNLYHSSKHLYSARVNYQKLVEKAVAGRKLVRSLAYVVKAEEIIAASENNLPVGERREPKTTKSEASFFDALEDAGLSLRVKDIQLYASGAKKADWDVGMAIDAVRSSDDLDVVILVTGDGDFIPLVEYLRWGKGKYVEIMAFSRTTNNKLKESGDLFVALEDVPRLLIKSQRRRRPHPAPSNNQN